MALSVGQRTVVNVLRAVVGLVLGFVIYKRLGVVLGSVFVTPMLDQAGWTRGDTLPNAVVLVSFLIDTLAALVVGFILPWIVGRFTTVTAGTFVILLLVMHITGLHSPVNWYDIALALPPLFVPVGVLLGQSIRRRMRGRGQEAGEIHHQ